MDVKSYLLHPEIKEELYFEQSMGFERLECSGIKLVCSLNKSIYGVKQPAENFYEKPAKILIEQNFVRSKNDYCLFNRIENYNKLFLLIWVDDLVIAASSSQLIQKLNKTRATKFKMDDDKNSSGSQACKLAKTLKN